LEKTKYKNLLSGLDEGVFGVDINGKCIFINDSALKQLGLEHSDYENKNFVKMIYNVSNDDIGKNDNCNICNTIRDGKQKSFEEVFYRKDGSGFDVDVIISPIIEDEIVNGAIVAFRDITNSKQTFDEIRKLHRAVEQSPVSIVITNLDGNIVYVNPKFEETTGYTFDEVKMQNPRILQSGLMPSELYKEMWDQLLDKQQWRGILQNKKKDGTIYWESANISPILNSKNEVTHYLGIKEDITASKYAEDRLHKFAQDLEWSNWELTTEIEAKKQIEKKLLENERKLQRIIEIIPVGINITDMEGNILDANIASEKILGINREDQLKKNQSDDDWKIIRPDGSEMPPDEFASVRAMKENKYVKDVVMGVKRGVDDITWINVSAMPLDIEGLGVVIAYIDITTIILTEIELKTINENLYFNQLSLEENQYLLNNTIEELEKSKHELLEINSTKDKFFSIIAHDLRSPFSGFLGLTKIMSEEIYNISMREVQEYAQTLQESAENLYKLLENLLEWSILQKGNKAFYPEYVNLNFIVKNNFEIYKAKANDKKLKIEYDIDRSIGVFADNNMLNGILRNLISNAGKFTPENGTISVSALDLGEFVQISVKDTGIGMPEEILQNVFIMGEKTSRIGTAGESSTGLGLILVKEYVERNNGKIWAESEEGLGSTFHFTLPKMME
jgi:PAS domain S-box-containing protein